MKKNLLTLILAFGVCAVHAQTAVLKPISPTGGVATKPNYSKIYPEHNQSGYLPSTKQQRRQSIHPPRLDSAVTNVYQIGSAGNAFGACCGSRTNLWYDPNLQTIEYYHRSTVGVSGSTGIGNIMYDFSPNNGTAWTSDQGPVYKDNATSGDLGGRYPEGVIYNPSGNTNPASSYATVYGPITDGTNWVDNYEGTALYNNSPTHNQQLFPTTLNGGKLNNDILEGMQIVKNTGTTWVVGNGVNPWPDANGVQYTNDSIFLAKGTYGSTDFNYDFSKSFYAPNYKNVPLSAVDSMPPADISTAWSDDGMIGYVVRLVNDTIAAGFVDSVLVPQVYKTVDGGNTWALRTYSLINMNINALDTAVNLAGILMTTAFDVDCGMDKNNNLHIAVSIGASPGGYSISTGYGNWGVFDIYTTDGGDTWYGEIVALPETFRCDFGTSGSNTDPEIAEDNRPQVTRSWDGSKIFISWFDTDTAEFGSSGNCSPDWHVRGLNVNTLNSTNGVGMWTDSLNMTDLTAADGFCTFASVSYYSINNGSSECIPMVFGDPQTVTSTGEAMQFYYADGGCVDSSLYTITGHPIYLGHGTLSVTEPKKNNFTVSANYPNPFTGATMVDVTLTKPENVTIQVSDMVGQILSTKTYNNLSSGRNHLTITSNDLAAGIYIYKVTVGSEMVARTMAVK